MNEDIGNWQSSIGFRIIVAIAFCIVAIILFGLPLFLSAGSLMFPNAWLFLSVVVVSWFLIFTYLAIKDPALFEKRTTARREERTQTILKLLLTWTFLGALVISGLDFRYNWSRVPLFVVVFFTFVLLFGNIVLFIVMKQNTYGSRAIEIQKNQQVIETGLYSVVRHPMYLAFSIIFCFAPLVLGSFYALILTLLMPILIALRIRYEEQVLRKGLDGYTSYMRKVRYRLIPYIW
jgi:protein-S-isoprenylcysteine O-methyltransferase Ste14